MWYWLTLQKRFVTSLISGNTDQALFSCFASPSRNSIPERFEIYRRNRLGTLFKTLKEAYPVCYTLVDEGCFNALCHLFIEERPTGGRLTRIILV